MLRLALFNLLHNKRRNIFLALFLSVCVIALSLFLGYLEYSREGMKLGAVSSTGYLVITSAGYWKTGLGEDKQMIDADTATSLLKELAKLPSISTNKILEFTGLVGTDKKSTVFIGAGSENVEKIGQSLQTKGKIVYSDDTGRVLFGEGLAKVLGLQNPGESVQLTASTPYGLALYTEEVTGMVTFPDTNANNTVVYTSLKNAESILGSEGSLHRVQIFITDESQETELTQKVKELIATQFPGLTVRTWQDLNPSYLNVMAMLNTQFLALLTIFLVCIFIAILQAVLNTTLERMKEFGTLRALGLGAYPLALMLLLEMLIVAVISIIVGLLISYTVKKIVLLAGVTVTPAGYTTSYPVDFIFQAPQLIALVILPVLGMCIIGCLYPLVKVVRLEVTKVLED